MDKIIKFLNGKKTYIIAAGIGVTACLSALGIVIPEWVWLVLNALGLGAIRDAISSSTKSQ
ncbi:MAG TPA: hypothetical protein PLB05_11150 [Candidatus Omnitrophota bacterium]|nr:hypothetical protein [Candidatus Omnitrophota bacterium]HPN57298.1 hypothetical protein [Candidatus Omnitrophota bacterium]